MTSNESQTSVLGRVLGGVFAGTIFGFLGEIFFFLDGPPHDRRILLVGPIIGAIVVAALAACLGNRSLPSSVRIIAIAMLSGIVVATFAGWALLPTIMMALNPMEGDGKHPAGYQIVGIVFGIPIGALAGLIIGVAILLARRPKTPSA